MESINCKIFILYN